MHKENPRFKNTQLTFEERVEDLISRMTPEEKASQLLHEAPGIDRLDIPPYVWWNEALHGVARAGKATVFPQAIGMAATFNTALIEEVATAISDEGRAKYHAALRADIHGIYRGITFWTPNINIFRDPRWGRGQETYGEDPFLTAQMGRAFVRGLQGTHPKYLKTAACAKHFAVHSGPEADRHHFNAVVCEKDLWETYLPAFKALVDEGVESVMGAYNRTNGEVCCGSPRLLGEILRDTWLFKGHVVSDCWAVRDFHENHKVTPDPPHSVARALKNGCDLNCGCTYEHVLDALQKGLIEEEDINRSLHRVLMTRMKLGMFDPPEEVPYASISTDVINCEAHRNLARKVARASCVLLKNDGILPLDNEIKKIYITGPNAANVNALISNYYGLSGRLTTVLEGITSAANETTAIDYRPGTLLMQPKENPFNWASFEARAADVVIAVVGLDNTVEGEEGDAVASRHKGDREEIELPENQIRFVEELCTHGKPVVLVIMAGSAVSIGELHEKVSAVMYTWYPGEAGGDAIADILFGRVSPSGRLPITVPYSTAQLPPYEDYSMQGRTYKYMTEKPQYPFGFGLTYGTIKYHSVCVEKNAANESVLVSSDITNEGEYDTDEIMQVYIQMHDAAAPTPKWSLAGFTALHLLAGETRRAECQIPREQFTSVDEKGTRKRASGRVTIAVGAASPSERSTELGAPEMCFTDMDI